MNRSESSRRGRWARRGLLVVALLVGLCAWQVARARNSIQFTGTLHSVADGHAAQTRPDQWSIDVAASPEQAARIRRAVQSRPSGDLDVEFMLTSEPITRYRGKVGLGPGERLVVRVHPVDRDIPEAMCLPTNACVRGLEVYIRARAPD